MSGDLLGGFDGPPTNGDNEKAQNNGSAPAAAATPSFDLLSGSPIKQEATPVITSLESATAGSSLGLASSENGDAAAASVDVPATTQDTTTTTTSSGAASTSTDSDSMLDFAKPPPPGTELPVAGVENSGSNSDEKPTPSTSANENGEAATTTTNNNPSLEHQPSINLLDFGGSSDGGGGSTSASSENLLDAPPSQPQSSPPQDQQPQQQPDLFEATDTTTEANLLDHRDSFAPVENGGGDNGGLVDLFAAAPGTTDTDPATAPTPATTVEDPFGAFSSPHAVATTTAPAPAPEPEQESNATTNQQQSPSSTPEESTKETSQNETSTCPESEKPTTSNEPEQPTPSNEPQNGEKPITDQASGTKSTAPSTETPTPAPSSTASNDEQSSENLPKTSPVAQHQDVPPPATSLTENGEVKEGNKEDGVVEKSPSTQEESNKSHDTTVPQIPTEAKATPKKAVPTLEAVPPSPAPETSDKESLQQHIQVLEKQLHAAHTLIMQLQHHENVEEERPGDAVMVELQANLEKEMNRRAEAENNMRLAQAECQKVDEEYKTFKEKAESSMDTLAKDLESIKSEKDTLLKEVEEIREERDEQARKEMALTARLNSAKKQEAVKANAAEHYEDQVEELQRQGSEYKGGLETMTAERDQLKQELGEWKTYAEKRTKQLETALKDEKKLNDERKRKMKGFVEAKTEEVRAAKADYISLQTELDQTSHSLKELNQRYKQLHAQWVQSQTRNRELQRDMTKMKTDSEKMLKAGGSLEARLSRSAQASEDHKNKRILAKHELMSVLSQLEAERAVNNRLQESIKMTFTPKALSQQQTIQEALDEFEGALHKLSTRLGRPLPPPPMDSNSELLADPMGDNASEDGSILGTNVDISEDDDVKSGVSASTNLSEINTNKVLQKLESETQRVSRNIVSFSTSVERMHSLLEGAGARNCVDVFSNMFLSGNSGQSEETRAITGSQRPTTRGGSRYGQVSGTMT